ncbi:MAG: hypothetical protein K5640_05065 [Treponema sp.]|nr:hypothetical protein [Treponema sp.]
MTKEELFKDGAFVKKVAGMKSVEEVKEAFAAKGVDISIDELNKIKEKAASGKLDDSDLDAVAGGSAVFFLDSAGNPIDFSHNSHQW